MNQASSAAAAGSAPNPSVFGQGVSFSATVTAVSPGSGTPTGAVSFFVDGTLYESDTLSAAGTATTTAPDTALAVGNHTVTATYAGDANFTGSTSPAITQVVTLAGSGTTLASSVNPSVFGQPVSFTATVAATAAGSGTPSGSVTFFADGSSIGSSPLSGGSAVSPAISNLAVGSHSVTATYSGDSNFGASTSAALGQGVGKAGTASTVASSAKPSVFGQPVSFSATVTAVAPGGGTPSGQVQFVVDGTNFGSPVSLSGGTASSGVTSTLSATTHSVSANYLGDGNFATSTGSLNGGQVVNQASTTTTMTSSANPSAPGHSVVFTATVTAVAPGAGTPTGQVLFQFNGGSLGLVNLVNGVAVSPATPSLPTGNYAVTATYQADTNFTSSRASLTQVVSQQSTTTTVTSSDHGSGPVGSPVTFTATVTNFAGTAATGNVAFFQNGASMAGCTAQPLSASAPDTATCSSTHVLPVGSSTITATYSGDSTDLASTSAPFTEATTATTTITGNHNGSITVGAGQTLFLGPRANVRGSITVQAGGSLDSEGASISGSLTTSGASQIRLCGSSLVGGVTIDGTSGLVVMGDDEGSPACAGNTIKGSVSITNGHGGVEFDFNKVTGSVRIAGNTGTVPPPDTGPVVAVGNTIAGTTNIQ